MKNSYQCAPRFIQEEDNVLLPYIREIVNERASYGGVTFLL